MQQSTTGYFVQDVSSQTCPTLSTTTSQDWGQLCVAATTQANRLEHNEGLQVQQPVRKSPGFAATIATTTDLLGKARAHQKHQAGPSFIPSFCRVTTAQLSNLVYMGGGECDPPHNPPRLQARQTKPPTADATTNDKVIHSVNSMRALQNGHTATPTSTQA